MDEITLKVAYSIMPDFGMAPWAWVKDAKDETTYIGPNMADGYGWYGNHAISKDLEQEFILWARSFDETRLYDADVANLFDWDAFHRLGLELTKRLKVELGEAARVYYIKPYEDANHEIEEAVEILLGGALKQINQLPRNSK